MLGSTVISLTFQVWVEEVIRDRFGTATALAKAVGMELSPFTRGVSAGTLNVANLLKLAKVTEERPSTVLRLAGKEALAALIEEMYGSDAISAAERTLLRRWRKLDREEREAFSILISDLAHEDRDRKATRHQKHA